MPYPHRTAYPKKPNIKSPYELMSAWRRKKVAYLNDIARLHMRCEIETLREADLARAKLLVAAEPDPGRPKGKAEDRYSIEWNVLQATGNHPDLAAVSSAVVHITGIPTPETPRFTDAAERFIRPYTDRLFLAGSVEIACVSSDQFSQDVTPYDFGSVVGLVIVKDARHYQVWPT